MVSKTESDPATTIKPCSREIAAQNNGAVVWLKRLARVLLILQLAAMAWVIMKKPKNSSPSDIRVGSSPFSNATLFNQTARLLAQPIDPSFFGNASDSGFDSDFGSFLDEKFFDDFDGADGGYSYDVDSGFFGSEMEMLGDGGDAIYYDDEFGEISGPDEPFFGNDEPPSETSMSTSFDAMGYFLMMLSGLLGLQLIRMSFYTRHGSRFTLLWQLILFGSTFELFLVLSLVARGHSLAGWLLYMGAYGGLYCFDFVVVLVLLAVHKRALRTGPGAPAKVPRTPERAVTSIAAAIASYPENVSKEATTRFLQRFDQYRSLSDHRRQMQAKGAAYTGVLALIMFTIVALHYMLVFHEYTQILSTQAPFYRTKELNGMESKQRLLKTYGQEGLQFDKRVVIVVVDGLRFDFLERNSALKKLLSSPSMKRDAKVFEIRNQLPSMSVPNWISILTGSPPQMTGVLGNLMVPETPYDNIYKQAKNYDIKRGLTGSPWFGQIVQSMLPLFEGDGTLSTGAGNKDKKRKTADPGDRLRWLAYSVAQDSGLTPYELFLTHFSDVDMQGHCCGVDVKYNKGDTYQLAITNKTLLISDMLARSSPDTVFMITSDHGHVDRGGHGGITRALRQVPLIVYSKDSAFGETPDEPADETFNLPDGPTNLDISASAAAILGIPVPRQCQGAFFPGVRHFTPDATETTHYRELWLQKLRLYQLAEQRTSTQLAAAAGAQSLNHKSLPAANATIKQYVAYTNEVMGFYDQLLTEVRNKIDLRNYLVSTGVILVLLFTLVYVFEGYTFASLFGVFPCFALLNCSDDKGSEATQTEVAAFNSKNRWAMLIAVCLNSLHFGLSYGAYVIAYTVYGYGEELFQSTVIHTPGVVGYYFGFSLVPSMFFALFITVGYHVFHFQIGNGNNNNKPGGGDNNTSCCQPGNPSWWANLFRALIGAAPVSLRSLDRIYLIRVYMAFWSSLSSIIFLFMIPMWSIVVPGWNPVRFVTEANWVGRFVVVTASLIMFPQTFLNFVFLLWWPAERKPSTYDPIYRLDLVKQRAGPRDSLLLQPEALELLGDATDVVDLLLEKPNDEIELEEDPLRDEMDGTQLAVLGGLSTDANAGANGNDNASGNGNASDNGNGNGNNAGAGLSLDMSSVPKSSSKRKKKSPRKKTPRKKEEETTTTTTTTADETENP